MVKFSGILLFAFILRLQENYVESFEKVVIVKNKQMTYNQKGELVEVKNEKKTKEKPVEIVEKSNIFKNSAFVTKSEFQGASNKFTSGLITKLPTSKPFPPVRSHLSHGIKTRTTKRTKVSRSSTPFPMPESTTTAASTLIVLNDELSSVQNTLQNSYDDIYNNFVKKYPQVTERPKPIESTHEKPSIFVYSTSTPLTMVPFFVPTKKKTKKKKLATTTPVPMIEHFMQNLDYYRKILAPNCTHPGLKKHVDTATISSIIKITPKPILKLDNPEHVSLIEKLKPEDTLDVADEGKKHKDSYSSSEEDDDHDHDKDKDKHKKKKKKKCKKKKKKHKKKKKKKKHGDEESGHEYHEHIHHYPVKEVEVYNGGYSKEPSKESTVYYDAPTGHGFDKTGLFDTFYSFFEDALTSKEFSDYGKADDGSYSESVSDSHESGHHHHRRKRSSTVNSLEKEAKSDDPKARKSMTTKITVTSEYDDSLTGQTTTKNPTTSNQQPIKTSTKRPKAQSSEELEEYTIYDEIIAPLQIGFDDSRGDYDDDDRLDSDEYYDEDPPASNRLPEGESLDNKIEDYSDENVAQSGSIFSGVTSMFSTLGGFISSLTGFRTDRSRKPPKRKYEEYDDYDEGRSTTEKVEQQSKRPKRENEPLPWYQPSFLFASDDNDDETAFSSTTQENWLLSPWNHLDDDESEVSPSAPSTTTVSSATSPETPSYDFLEMFTNYISPKQKSLTGAKPKSRLRRKKYDGYQLWRLFPSTKDDAKFIEEFKMSSEGVRVHWLKGPSWKGVTDVVIAPDFVENFTELLSDNDIKFIVKVRDVQHAIQYENPRLNKRDQIELEVIYGHPLTWFRYHPYKDIQSYFDFLKRKFPNNTELIPIGWSFEGRPMTIVKLQHNDELAYLRKEHRSDLPKPAVFIQSGSEAHEWLPIACSTFILNKLVMSLDSNSAVTELLKKVDFYILPVMNPDGYDYSIYYERLWQKTRSQHVPSSGIWSTA